MHDSARYVLVGGGPTAAWAATNIRQGDPEGRIILLAREAHPPYDKPPLSKQALVDDAWKPDDAYSKADDFYSTNRVDLRTGVEVTRIDRAARTVTLANGDTVGYEKLLLATGATPRELDVPGSDLPGIHYLRTLDDCLAIRGSLRRAHSVAFVGAGFIGMEVASGALERGLDVTIIEQADQPWGRIASPKLGGFLQRYYEGHGARFLFGQEVSAFTGTSALSGIETKSGEHIPADMAVVGVGVTLNTQLAENAGLDVDPKQGVRVDEHLRTADPGIWAAGDIAFFQDVALNKRWHAEHHLNAKWQGRAVGAIMAGETKPYDQVAYFYSDFLDLHMSLRGDPSASHDTTVLGSMDDAEFIELYPGPDGEVRMGVAISHDEKRTDAAADALEKLIRAKTQIAGLTLEALGWGPAEARRAA